MMVANSQNLIITVRPANQEVGIALPQEELNYGSLPTSSRSSARYSPTASIQQSTENLSIEANEITQEAARNKNSEELNRNLPSNNEDLPSKSNHQLPSENLQYDASEFQSEQYDDHHSQDQINHVLQHDEVASNDNSNLKEEHLPNDEYDNNHYEEHEDLAENYYDIQDSNEVNNPHQQVATQDNHSEAPRPNDDHADSDDYSGDEV